MAPKHRPRGPAAKHAPQGTREEERVIYGKRNHVVVIGGGFAGYTVALEALALGATVEIVEKGTYPGGTTLQSGGTFAFAGTDLQAASGIDDSPAILREDLLAVGGPAVDRSLIDLYVRDQLAALEWLRGLGVVFDSVSHSGGQSQPRSHATDIHRAFGIIRSRAESHPHCTLHLDEGATRLILDSTRAVRGVVTVNSAGEESHRLSGAVVLATGGFTRGLRAIATFAPELLAARPLGGRWNTGDGLYLAMAAGADLRDVGEAKPTFGVSADLPGYPADPILLNTLYRGGIVVNSRGRRFVDESISYKLVGQICLEQPAAIGYQIFDAKTMAQSSPYKMVNNFTGGLERGYIREATTIERIARDAGIDEDGLRQTIERYNADTTRGVDQEFGRSSLGTGFGTLAPIDSPPYYVYPSTAGLTSTYGGLRINEQMRVMHVDGTPIGGLWAVGELVGGFHGHGYMSGSSLGKAVIFGRLAAASAVAAQTT